METMIMFLTVLAWFGGILAPLWIFCKFKMHNDYENSIEKTLHSMKGYTMNYAKGSMKYVMITILSWAWIVSTIVSE